MTHEYPIVMEGRGLSKSYGTITALDNVSVQIRLGEICAIVGDNGAGKSSLIRILSGAIQPDEGEIYSDEKRITLKNPAEARALGIETIYQDLALAPNRDVVENLFLGREVCRGGLLGPLRLLDRGSMRRRAAEQLKKLEVDIPRTTGAAIGSMSGGQRQAVAVARAAFWASKVMFMDEPTAALGVREAGAVLRLARRIADNGLAVVMVSHVLPHVMELADRVIVLRHGMKVAEITEELSMERLVGLIVGIDAGEVAPGKEL